MTGISPGGAHRHWKAWVGSIAVHAILLAAAVLIGRHSEGPVRSLPVSLRSSAESVLGMPDAPAGSVGVVFPTPRARPERPRPPLGTRPPVTILLPPPPLEGDDGRGWNDYDRESVRSWTEHSLAAWLAECREGRAVPDTLLERSAAERSRDELAEALHHDFILRAPAWEHERFLEAYRRNFPLMR